MSGISSTACALQVCPAALSVLLMVGIKECTWRMPVALKFLFKICRRSALRWTFIKVDRHVDALIQQSVFLVKRNTSNISNNMKFYVGMSITLKILVRAVMVNMSFGPDRILFFVTTELPRIIYVYTKDVTIWRWQAQLARYNHGTVYGPCLLQPWISWFTNYSSRRRTVMNSEW